MPNFLDTVRQALAKKQAQNRPNQGQQAVDQVSVRPTRPKNQKSQVRRGAARGG